MMEKTDMRLRGFANRSPLSAAWAWLDALPMSQPTENMPLAAAVGRVLAQDLVTPHDEISGVHAAEDGYAVRAADCDGASAYNPLLLALRPSGCHSLAPETAAIIAAGWRLPEGADAVLPFEATETSGDQLAVLSPVARSAGTRPFGHGMVPGATLRPRGRTIGPHDLAPLATAGAASVCVVARPMVRLHVPGPKTGADVLSPMLRALLERDGARVEQITSFAAPTSGITLIAGRSGAGPDDDAAPTIRACGGELAFHGLTLQPGGSSGLGTLAGHPLLLLPGDPVACRAAYDLLGARLLRRLAGLPPSPYATARLPLARKIVSGIGVDEVVLVRVAEGRAHPIDAGAGLPALLADGFVFIPSGREGVPAAAAVTVHCYHGGHSGSDCIVQ